MKSLEDFVMVRPGAIPADLCQTLVETYKNSDEWFAGEIGEGTVKLERRNCSVLYLDNANIVLSEDRIRHINSLRSFIGEGIRIYRNQVSSYFMPEFDEGLSMLRYNEGDYYREHVDCANGTRTMSVIMNLSEADAYEGGDFQITGMDPIHLGQGDMVFFPSQFQWPHQIHSITSGTRYSVVTWLTSG